ncbi:MAG TPA: CinA family protein [Methylotenera sp.]|nr:CinA family protein [Methylotenera sp.]
MDALTTLSIELGALLKARGLKLALAESCTGGMVAEAVTRVAGSSAWFDCGLVTYSNQAKIDMLGVPSDTLEKFGAVSEQTAVEMALGALKHSQAQIAGSITGIAGPDGGSTEKPVGTVCFAWIGLNKSANTATQHFAGNRQQIRQQAAAFLMQRLIELLKQTN